MRSSVMAVTATLIGVIAGCGGVDGPELIPAGGTVKYQGKPLAGARVTFIPEGEGSVAMSTTDSQGKFELKTGTESGVVAGPSKVTVTMMESGVETGLSKDMTPEDMQALAIAGKLDDMLKKQERSLIPKKYARPETSGLSYEVKKGEENQFPIELTE